MKAPWYDAMSVEPLGIFSERDRKKHADRRRLLKPAFGQAAINEVEPTIDMLVLKLVNRILEARENPVDVLSSFRRLSLDVVGELFFGQSFKALDDDQMPQFLEWMDNQFVSLGIKYAFPPVHWLLRQLPFEGLRQMMLGPERIREYGRKTFEQYINENSRESTRRDLLTKFLSANLAAEKAGESAVLGDLEMQCEIGNLIFGGTDTTSTTLTYLFWELAKHQAWQDRLREELLANVKSNDIPKMSALADLPILDSVINESLRLHPAAPASLVRTAPAGGRVIDGQYVPEGVSVQLFVSSPTHRFLDHRIHAMLHNS
ncbi:hypothetical protein LTR64_008350 [Lithohypha guttulata]|uniref:uncharacterized protein n=1 Tax=Lithohypha guttulata TaxID=1690604 RepID=UPI002DDF5917|nr:hypothetical protein LTR51_005920 [Lithohypha guttulata]